MESSYFSPLLDLFEANKNEELIPQMTAYMKNHFSYYGIKAPQRKKLQQQFIKENGMLSPSEASKEIRKVWNNCNREVNYVILDIIRLKKYWENKKTIEFDVIAAKLESVAEQEKQLYLSLMRAFY